MPKDVILEFANQKQSSAFPLQLLFTPRRDPYGTNVKFDPAPYSLQYSLNEKLDRRYPEVKSKLNQ